MYGMIKTTVYLTEDLKASLARMAEEQQRSEAELIREAIQSIVSARDKRRPKIPLTPRGLGDSTVAERVDDHLDGFGTS